MKGIEEFDETSAIVAGSDAEFVAAIGAGALDRYTALTVDGKATTVPAAIARLTGLQELTLCPKVASVDAALFELAQLRRLCVQSPRLAALPEGAWGRLTALTSLEIAVTGLTRLPADLGDAPRLGGSFDLRGHKFKALPESFGRLAHVELLAVPAGLKALPSTLAGMQRLRSLTLYKARLGALPDAIGALRELVELHANDAGLKRVPDALAECVALEELHLGENALRTIPAGIGLLPRLRLLALEDNPLTAIPEALPPTLEFLKLRGTEIQRLPPAVAELTRLRMVTLPEAHRAAIEASSGPVLAALGDVVRFAV